MRPFNYARPQSLREASQLLSTHTGRAALMAGGTDLIVQMGRGLHSLELAIDIKRVSDLGDQVEKMPGGVRIGALTRLEDLAANEVVRASFPALSEAAGSVGSVQIRSRATIAGNICNASPAADTAPPLLAYGAQVNIFGIAGRRTLSMERFFTAPGKTALLPGEIVESLDLAFPKEGTGSAFERLARRAGMDVASVSVACLVWHSGSVRLGFGAVGPTPIVAEGEETDSMDWVGEYVKPVSDIRAGEDYRRAMVVALSRRAVKRSRKRMGEDA